MTQSFVEHREVGVADPLRQGDVLESIDINATPWNRHLLVITADCDLAHAKNQGRVTCVPLLSQHEYLSEVHLPKTREKAKARLLSTIQALPPANAQVSSQRLAEWASEEEPERIAKILGFDESGNEQLVIDALGAIRDLNSSTNFEDQVQALILAKTVCSNSMKRSTAAREVAGILKDAYVNTPGDALFLSSIASGHDGGHFAYLRHIEQVWQPSISTGPGRRDVTYRRVSRLLETVTHALVQKFALVFMSIGLPSEYEDLRSLYSDYMGESIK